MKYLKVTLALFIFTLIISSTVVDAAVKGIAGLEIPNFGGIANTGLHLKEAEDTQKFSLVKCTESVTGKETEVEVQTYMSNGGTYSDWKTAIKGQTVVISETQHRNPGYYKLNVRATSSSNWLTSSLYGTWVLG